MRYICGFRNNIVMIKNSDKFSIIAYTIADAIESNKDDKILGITDEGISKEDFVEDITSKGVILNRYDLVTYYLKLSNLGCDVTDIYIRMPYIDTPDEKMMSYLLSLADLYCSERRSYAELVDFVVRDSSIILLFDAVALKGKYEIPKSIKDKIVGDIELGDDYDTNQW